MHVYVHDRPGVLAIAYMYMDRDSVSAGATSNNVGRRERTVEVGVTADKDSAGWLTCRPMEAPALPTAAISNLPRAR